MDCLALPAEVFKSLFEQNYNFAAYFRHNTSLIEIFEVLGAELNRKADGVTDLKQLAIQAQEKP